MQIFFRRAVFLLILATATVLTAAEPEVLSIDFSKDQDSTVKPSWASSYEVIGGTIGGGAWKVDATGAVGLGQVDILLNPEAHVPALAITLAFADLNETDLSIHLHNAAGELVAVDLFGNLADSSREGRTDTFVVPLAKYPDAVRISIRRIKGPLEIHGLVAFPVLESLDDLTQDQKQEFARLLGERLAASPGHGGAFTTQGGRARAAATESVLNAADYPERAWKGTMSAANAFPAYCSGTCYRFFSNLYLSLFLNVKSGDKVEFVSSDTALKSLIAGQTNFAMISQPPNDEQRKKFQAKFGHPMLEVPIALDAVEILVNPANKAASISFESLKGIFAEDGRSPRYWDSETGLSGPIVLAGGYPEWGTSQFFAQRVMGGLPFRASMAHLDVAFPRGVEIFVSQNRSAIGFAQHRNRTNPVRVLPVSENSVPVAVDAVTVNDRSYPLTRNLYLVLATDNPAKLPEPIRRFADLLLSREGQTVVADSGSFPLDAAAVRQARRQLALP